jgi:hypothetical protein
MNKKEKRRFTQYHCWHKTGEYQDVIPIKIFICCFCGKFGRAGGRMDHMPNHGLHVNEIDWGTIVPEDGNDRCEYQ